MGRLPLSAEKKQSDKKKLVEATKQIIIEEGMAAASVRNIAAHSGINGAIIYRYFIDADELILYAVLDLLKNYNTELGQFRAKNPEEAYLLDWALFCDYVLHYAEHIYHLFFGKHSGDIDDVINGYFELYPVEEAVDSPIFSIVRIGNIRERNMMILRPVLEGKMSSDDIEMINELTISYFKELLEQTINDPETDLTFIKERMLRACSFLIK